MIIKHVSLSSGIKIKYVQYPRTIEEDTRERFQDDQRQALSVVSNLLAGYINQNQVDIEKITFKKIEQLTEVTAAVKEISIEVSYKAKGGRCYVKLDNLTDDLRTVTATDKEKSIPGMMDADLIEAVDALYKKMQQFAEGKRMQAHDLFTDDKAS